MRVKRRRLPYPIVDKINQTVLRKYKQASTEAVDNIRKLLMSKDSVTDDELVMMNLSKSTTKEDMAIYEQGEKVEVRVGEEWMQADVVSAANGIKVKRADGEQRVISDQAKIRKVEGQSFGKGIFLEKFNVRILEGTKSYEIETALEPITARMNQTPLSVNFNTWEKNTKVLADLAAVLMQKCIDISGNEAFQPNSTNSCVAEFRDKRRFAVGKTPSGAPSVDQAVLQHIANQGDDLAPVVLETRHVLSKLSQMKAWEPFAKSGSVQAMWDQYGQPHGRYTSDTPSLQNRVLEVRETVEAKPGFKFVSADWGQAEYNTWASLSKDQVLGEIFKSGRDLHQEMGYKLEKSMTQKVDDVRDFGKTVNFALLYRMQSWTLARKLGVDANTANDVVNGYASIAPSASKYSLTILNKAAIDGYVETWGGRRLYCPMLRKQTGAPLHQAQKTVWHHHNAGTAAELLKLKTVDLMKALASKGIDEESAHVALNMYDEIIMEVREDLVPVVYDVMEKTMKEVVEGFLPFNVTMKIGQNWLEISK